MNRQEIIIVSAAKDEYRDNSNSCVGALLKIIDRLDKQVTGVVAKFTPRIEELFDGFYVVDDQCQCEEGCGPECINEDSCPCIAHEVVRLGEALRKVKGE